MTDAASPDATAGVLNWRIRLMHGDDIAFGPGKAALLEAIAREGSISAAARALGMSYRRAWLLVDTMNRCFRAPLVLSSAGGAQGGGARLSPFGEEVLAHYRMLTAAALRAAEPHAEALRALLR